MRFLVPTILGNSMIRILSYFLLGCFSISQIAEASNTIDLPDKIEVSDRYWTIHGGGERKTVYKRNGSLYESGVDSISERDIAQLLILIQKSKAEQAPNLVDLGITPSSVAEHLDVIIAAAQKSNPRLYEIIEANGFKIGYPEAMDAVAHLIKTDPGMLGGSGIKIDFQGKEKTTIRSQGQASLKLPWKLETDLENWNSASVPLAQFCYQLFPVLKNRHGVDAWTWWQEWFWKDTFAWQTAFIKLLNRKMPDLMEHLRHPENKPKNYRLMDASIMNNWHPELSLTFASEDQKSLIDEIIWRPYFLAGSASGDWKHLDLTLRTTQREARKISWLDRWKNEGPERKTAIWTRDTLTGSENAIEKGIGAAWHALNLKGSPQSFIMLRDHGTVILALVSNPAEEKILAYQHPYLQDWKEGIPATFFSNHGTTYRVLERDQYPDDLLNNEQILEIGRRQREIKKRSKTFVRIREPQGPVSE